MQQLFFLLWIKLVPLRMVGSVVPGYVSDVWDVATVEAPLYTRREFAAFHTAMLLGLWCARESGGVEKISSPDGKDHGVCQMRTETLAKLGSTPEAVRKDRKLGLQLALQWMRTLKGLCASSGSVAAEYQVECALRAYASGSFTKGHKIVENRCAMLGSLGCLDTP